tara:strand:- start:11 stop:331 length:321 start_codon:yes stop_codon:yes gene_type:complete
MTDYLLTGLLFDLLFWSLLLWQIGIITYILLNKFYDKNPRTISNNQPRQMAVEVDLPKKKSIEHVDVAMNKNIIMDKPKVTNLRTDEVIKGKVNTQKNKLKKLRGL